MRFIEPTPEQEAACKAWIASRPPHVRAVAERFEPWSLYRLKSTGQRVTIASFGEHDDGTVTLTVTVSGAYNAVMFERNVFGIDPDDLEPCDLPASTEPTGAVLTSEQVDEHIDALRVMGRPDLWTIDPATGKAVPRKATS